MNRHRLGTPEPQAIDDVTGFKVPLRTLVRQWDGAMTQRRHVDRRNPQDFVKGVRDDQSLRISRPDSPAVFIGPGDVTADDL